MVKTSLQWGECLIPGQEVKIPHASWRENQNIKQKQYCNTFSKNFKNGPHQKKKKSNNCSPKGKGKSIARGRCSLDMLHC